MCTSALVVCLLHTEKSREWRSEQPNGFFQRLADVGNVRNMGKMLYI